jgi:hypothetical protein
MLIYKHIMMFVVPDAGTTAPIAAFAVAFTQFFVLKRVAVLNQVLDSYGFALQKLGFMDARSITGDANSQMKVLQE